MSERSSSVIVGSDTTYAPLPAGGVSFSCPVIVPVAASTDVSFSFSCSISSDSSISETSLSAFSLQKLSWLAFSIPADSFSSKRSENTSSVTSSLSDIVPSISSVRSFGAVESVFLRELHGAYSGSGAIGSSGCTEASVSRSSVSPLSSPEIISPSASTASTSCLISFRPFLRRIR